MGLMDILQQYVNNSAGSAPNNAAEHFDQVSAAAPPEIVGQGVGDAFRSDNTPPFAEMVGQMFGQSNPQQQAGVLNQLLRSLGPGVLAALAGGIFGRMTAPSSTGLPQSPPQLTPEQASQVTPEQLQDIATRAEQHDPTVLDKIGGIYAQHPQLVKTLGSAALAIALAGVASRMNKQNR